jgi:hypothetical protein
MKNAYLLFLVCLALPCILSAQQNSYVSPAGTKFLLYTPPSYATGSQTHPLLISLHGKGEMGDDINNLTVNNAQQPPSRLIYLNRWSKDLPFLVLSPLYNPPVDELNPQWPAEYIDEVVNYVIANYRVDLSRIYVTGLSLGGTGTWTYAAAYPSKVAAVLPIAGRSDLTKACALKNIPAWVFHGDGDPTVTMQYSIDLIAAINSCNVSARYKRRLSVMHARPHSGWSEVYNGSNGNRVYEWLLKFQKNSNANTTPYVNAGLDRTIVTRPGSIHFYGDYFDSDGSISSVLWKQVSGAPLTLANTTSEFFKVSNLLPGIYEFELTVTDNSGAVSTDRVKLTILSSTTLPVVNRLVLMNGQSNLDIMNLTEGMVINKAQLGITQVNIRAEGSANTSSVRFSINADQHTRTINTPGPYLIKSQSTNTAEWEVRPGHYVICATPFASTGASGTPGCVTCVKLKVVDEVSIPGCTGYGRIQREIWPGVPGTAISSIPVTTTPAAKTDLLLFETPTDVWDNFGERIRGFVCPPTTGNYTFWISGNDNCELWLSTDATATNKRKIAYVSGYTNVRQWTKYPAQQSLPVTLNAGTMYYIEALHKEGIESDHLAVGWQLPNGTYERPIPGIRLIPLATGASERIEETQIPEDEGPFSFSIYPNPLRSDEAQLHLRGIREVTKTSHASVEILSMAGLTLSTKAVTCETCDEFILELDSRLKPGVYIVMINGNRKRLIKRLVVQ